MECICKAYTQQVIPSLRQYKINFHLAWNVFVRHKQQAIPSLRQYKINFNIAWNVSVNAYTQQAIPSQ
jgi:hypothetical protein